MGTSRQLHSPPWRAVLNSLHMRARATDYMNACPKTRVNSIQGVINPLKESPPLFLHRCFFFSMKRVATGSEVRLSVETTEANGESLQY